MAKTPNEYIALSLDGKSDAFRTAYADMQDTYEAHQAEMRRLGTLLLSAAETDGFRVPSGKTARIVLSRFDGKPQIMLSDAAAPRRSF
jgi:folate-dependent tRNA-U54 methylase TrmFO/GidA